MMISVVVPSYNHERYLRRCLGSIDAQDHDDLEVIVVDDGSTDGSWDVISSYRWRSTRRVQLVRTDNAGAHAALNRGLDLATGRYVALCNSDDAFAHQRVSTLERRLEASGARFAFSGVRFVNDIGDDVGDRLPYAQDLVRKQEEIVDYPSVGFAIVLTNVAVSTGNFFFDRTLIREIGYFRPYRYVHDWDFLLRTVLVTEPLYVPERLYAYRLHGSNSFSDLEHVAAVECPELMRRFMKATHSDRYPNRLAPSPRNWPGYFQFFVEEHRYQPYLTQWEDIDGPEHWPPSTRYASAGSNSAQQESSGAASSGEKACLSSDEASR